MPTSNDHVVVCVVCYGEKEKEIVSFCTCECCVRILLLVLLSPIIRRIVFSAFFRLDRIFPRNSIEKRNTVKKTKGKRKSIGVLFISSVIYSKPREEK